MPHADAARTRDRDATLASTLMVFAHPVRIALLRELRVPQALSEIRVRARPFDAEGDQGPPLARQTVRENLDKLIAIGAVYAREAERRQGLTTEYVLNHQALFSIAEEFRALARLRPLVEPARGTLRAPEEAGRARLPRPCLVLVKGLDEGRAFPLTRDAPASWTIGRSASADVRLDYDPYVSAESALVRWTGTRHEIEAMPDARNGMTLNFEPIAAGERYGVESGDLIGLGRSLLMYRG